MLTSKVRAIHHKAKVMLTKRHNKVKVFARTEVNLVLFVVLHYLFLVAPSHDHSNLFGYHSVRPSSLLSICA